MGGNNPSPTERVLATVMFTDIVGSTERAAAVGDRGWRRLLDVHDGIVADAVSRARGTLVKSTGDGSLSTFDGPARAIRCATTISEELESVGLPISTGIHTGEIERRGEDVGGLAVHIAARVQSAAGAGEILVSRTVTDLVIGSGLGFQPRGTHTLKGVPGEWELFAVDR